MYSKTNTISLLENKPDKTKEIFAEAANTALTKGLSLDESKFAGLAAVKAYEKANTTSRPVIEPKVVPLHVQALIKAKAANDFIAETKRLEIEKQEQAVDFVVNLTIDNQNRLITTYNSGKKTTSKSLVADLTEIHNTIIAGQQQVQKYSEPLTTLVSGNPELIFTSEGDVVMQLLELTEG